MISGYVLGRARLDGQDTAAIAALVGRTIPRRAHSFSLQEAVRTLDFEPKNKPFLLTAAEGLPKEANRYLQAWPEGWRMAQDLLVALYPCDDPRYVGNRVMGGCYGCKSTDASQDFGHVYASVMSTVGFVEGIVASLANWKLYACGLIHDRWDAQWLKVSEAETYPLPLRPHERVPVGSLIHHAYCCAHILDFHQHLLALPEPPRGAAYGARTAHERVTRAVPQLRRIRGAAPGDSAAFLDRLLEWADYLLSRVPPTEGE